MSSDEVARLRRDFQTYKDQAQATIGRLGKELDALKMRLDTFEKAHLARSEVASVGGALFQRAAANGGKAVRHE